MLNGRLTAMTAAIATPISQIELTPGSAIRIGGVTWEGYIALLKELGDDRSTRVAYENGVLEIRMPGQPHEAANRVLATIALTLAEEFGFVGRDGSECGFEGIEDVILWEVDRHVF